jgi:peptidoglycan/LPS O-acetylase OafA/YrhL
MLISTTGRKKILLRFFRIQKHRVRDIAERSVWTFGIRGFLFGEHDFFNISNLLWHMDNGYWFLISLWTITCLFTLAQWLSVFLCNNDLSGKRIVITTAFYLIFMGALAGIGLLMGLSFFCIKLTLYYMPFFYAGYLFGQYQDRLLGMRHAKKWLDAVVSICVFVWLFLLKRYNLFNMSESVGGIFIRITASITGCIAICGFTSIRNKNGNISQKFGGGVRWMGVHSLQIYLLHYLLLNMLKPEILPFVTTVQGASLVAINWTITILSAYWIIQAIATVGLLQRVLFVREA